MKLRLRYISVFFLLHIAIFRNDGGGYRFNVDIINQFESFTQKAIQKLRVPGAAVAIVIPNKLLSLKTYGVRKLGSCDKIDQHTIFRIASLSKGLTAALALKLVNKGSLHLDTPIKNYLPHFPYNNHWLLLKDISIKHILSHTSGISHYFLEHNAYVRQPFSKLMTKLIHGQPTYNPGEKFQYQNVIFSLMDPIVSSVTNASFAAALKKEILIPLGMYTTYLKEKTYKQCNNVAHPHINQGSRVLPIAPNYFSYYYNVLPAGGIASSVSDMSKWLQALLGGDKLLDKEDLHTLFTPLVPVEQRKRCCKDKFCFRQRAKLEEAYGLGWYIQNYYGETVIFHGGILNGFTCRIVFSPKYRIGIVVLTNTEERHLPSLLHSYFFDLLFGYTPRNRLEGLLKIGEREKEHGS